MMDQKHLTVNGQHAKSINKSINQSVSQITEKCKTYLRLPLRWDVWSETLFKTLRYRSLRVKLDYTWLRISAPENSTEQSSSMNNTYWITGPTQFSLYSYHREEIHLCRRYMPWNTCYSCNAADMNLRNFYLQLKTRLSINKINYILAQNAMADSGKHNVNKLHTLQYNSPPCDLNFSTNDCS